MLHALRYEAFFTDGVALLCREVLSYYAMTCASHFPVFLLKLYNRCAEHVCSTSGSRISAGRAMIHTVLNINHPAHSCVRDVNGYGNKF